MPSVSQATARAVAALPAGTAMLHRAAGLHEPRRAPVFMLHRVLPEIGECYDPEMAVSTDVFAHFLDWVTAHYEVVRVAEVKARLNEGSARPACALTFDDGWVDTFEHAFPLLQQRGLTATIFLPVAFIGTQRHFWQDRLQSALRALSCAADSAERLRRVGDQFAWCADLGTDDLDFHRLRRLLTRRASPEAEAFVEVMEQTAGITGPRQRRFMNWDEVRQMQRAGFEFGSHTLQHTLLSWAPPAEAARELEESRRQLQEHLGTEVRSFSYPWGGFSRFGHAQVRAAGYSCAVTTRMGLVRADTDAGQLPRLALSQAQLGALSQGCFHPPTLLVQLARARRAPPAPASTVPQPLRIGFLVDNPEAWGEPPQGHLGGSELQLLRLIEALDQNYFQPELYFLQPPASGLPTQLPWPVWGPRHSLQGRWRTIAHLRDLLRQQRPDIVQSMFVDSTFLGVTAAWLAGVPAILCARRNAGYWKRWYHRAALRIIDRMATSWQVNARVIAEMLQKQESVPKNAIEIVPNWIDLQGFHPASPAERQEARRRLGLGAEDYIGVCVANYSPVKNLGVLVSAAARLRTRMPQLRLLLVGDGPERDRLQQEIAANRIGDRVRLEGTSDQISVYLAAADCGILPSRSEGCSNAVLEYMASGLPTLLSDIPANRCLADQALFPVGDAEALADRLAELAEAPPLRAQLGERNRRRAEQYGGTAFASRVQGHYLRVAASGRGHSPA